MCRTSNAPTTTFSHQYESTTKKTVLGVLRFTSPKRAWLIDAALGGGHEHTTIHVTYPSDTVLSSFESNASISLRLGRRFYQGPGQKTVSFQTLGFLGGFSHSAGSSSGGASAERNGWSAGLFGELGAAFFVASKLSLGELRRPR